MHVFIVRPFGIKKVLKEDPAFGTAAVEIDFEKVETELLAPAITAVQLQGGTTGKIFEPGDIREDMFSLLLRAEIVIADITIHNANVFYELGIRHALRDKMTILVKSQGISETPFDILGYRYVSYDRDAPSNALGLLIQTIKETIASKRVDSPVFKMLPKLKAQDYERFVAAPEAFAEEVRIAAEAKQPGKLSLLGYETERFSWQIPGLRLIGEALYQLKTFDSARFVWEKIKSFLNEDVQANERLATIYQRLAEREMTQNLALGEGLFTRSQIAIDTLLSDPNALDKDRRAEAFALKGRNIKAKWISNWKTLPDDKKGLAALQSDLLEDAYKSYEQGYYHNMNHFYAGINALSLLTIRLELIKKYPAVWINKFSRSKEADREKEDLLEKKQRLSVALQLTIDAEKQQLQVRGKPDIWLDITGADFIFLTESSEGRITSEYAAALEGAPASCYEAVQRQLMIFRQLDILNKNAEAGLSIIPPQHALISPHSHYLLFTGHMIDKPGRMEPRFPASMEAAARQKIKEYILDEMKDDTKIFKGIAGGACGGDILFHEVCQELCISSELYLALPREEFIKASVEFAGANWTDRFNRLFTTIPHHTLCDTPALPRWLEKKKDYSIWERNNIWELSSALVNGGMHLSLIALWDGKGGDGPGGTVHMVNEARSKGAKTLIIDINTLSPNH